MSDSLPPIEWIDSCDSTNSRLAALAPSAGELTLATRCQTAGRGQRGNSWEAEPGRNLTFSMLLRPRHIPAARSFEISMVVALALTGTLQRHLPAHIVEVKWPNDIYVADRKLCGILIENSFCGTTLERVIAGIGVNVNQTVFESDAPNPVSMARLTGRTFALEPLLAEISDAIASAVHTYDAHPQPDSLAERYHAVLWRRTGTHPWLDCRTGRRIEAAIRSVALTGHLTLDTDPPLTYAFKEISAIL